MSSFISFSYIYIRPDPGFISAGSKRIIHIYCYTASHGTEHHDITACFMGLPKGIRAQKDSNSHKKDSRDNHIPGVACIFIGKDVKAIQPCTDSDQYLLLFRQCKDIRIDLHKNIRKKHDKSPVPPVCGIRKSVKHMGNIWHRQKYHTHDEANLQRRIFLFLAE